MEKYPKGEFAFFPVSFLDFAFCLLLMCGNSLVVVILVCVLFVGVVGEDAGEAVKDQLREGYCKEGSDDLKPKGVSDYILPHILNL